MGILGAGEAGSTGHQFLLHPGLNTVELLTILALPLHTSTCVHVVTLAVCVAF